MQLLGKSAVKGRWRRKVRFIELGFADAHRSNRSPRG
jgi:hypothetical protein